MGSANAVEAPRDEGAVFSEGPGRLEALVREHFDRVYRVAVRLGVPSAVAEDAAQEVFVIAARKVHLIEPGHERQFLIGTTVRVAANLRRALRTQGERSKAEDAEHSVDPRPLPDAILEAKEMRGLLERVLLAMPDDQRAAFVLFEFEGLSQPEIAEVVRAPVGTVASRLRRAREIFDAKVAELRLEHRRLGRD